MRRAAPAPGTIDGAEARIVRPDLPGVVEWWRSDPRGLEHGVTLAERPDGEGALVLDLAVASLTPRSLAPDAIVLDRGGVPVATYSGLVVRDAHDRRVAASLRVHEGAIRIEVEDRDAAYPLVVDPLVVAFEARLIRPGAPSDGAAAVHVGMSADGTRAIVGYRGGATGIYTFARTGTLWAPDGIVTTGADTFALSSDGNTIAVVASNTLTVYGFVSGAWVAAATFTPACPAGTPQSVGMSGDGTWVLVAGSPSCASGGGVDSTAQVYASSAGTWGVSGSIVGASAISSVDQTGTRATSTSTVFVRSGTSWGAEFQVPPNYGDTVISADGSRIVAGWTITGGNEAGIFVRSGASWSLETANLGLGTSVAISADGARAFVADASGRIHVSQRSGTTWTRSSSTCDGLASSQGADLATSSDGGRVVAGVAASANNFDAIVCRTNDATGTPCSAASTCASGFCVDGFCCNTACGGGSATDCMACGSPLTGTTNGICAPLSASAAPTVVCRASAGACDVAETCVVGNATCPADRFASGTLCRAALGPCDVPDVCSGSSAACADAFVAAGTTCRFAFDVCDVPETCTGSNAACPTDALAAAGTMCRPGTGTCDPDDTCTGTTSGCPAVFASGTTVCRAATSVCDVTEHCTGATPECPPDSFAPASTVCAAAGAGVCDAPDLCSGSSATCVPTFATGVVCRVAGGGCDVSESCSGTSAGCPPDGVLSGGVVCRAGTSACDPVEVCDGVSTSCPADETCTPGSDAGNASDAATRDAGAGDASPTAPDGGSTVAPSAGCACRARRGRTNEGLAWIGVLGLAMAARRRSAARRR